jgi:hypothetical protein
LSTIQHILKKSLKILQGQSESVYAFCHVHIPSFFTATITSQTSKRHLSACNIWTFSRRFSRNLTPRAPKKYFNSSCVLFILIICFDVKLVSNKIDTYLKSLWRHERYLFSVFRGILPAIFRRFSKKLSTSVVVHQTIFYQIIIKCTEIVYIYIMVSYIQSEEWKYWF